MWIYVIGTALACLLAALQFMQAVRRHNAKMRVEGRDRRHDNQIRPAGVG